MRQYLASQGDVWDYLSWKLYHDEGFIHTLLAANPTLRHIVQFTTPTMINVPDRPQTRTQTSANLPPWKRV
ncbi:MAG: tail protein X [Dysgonamonadaceae bacterium]|nr:tail protein X [Dysgonamonadaceae bacterium]